MNKLLLVLSLIICSCSTSPKYLSFDDALETGMQKIESDLPEGSQVAILDFKSANENLSSYIIEEMYDKMVNFGKLVIMERSRTDTIAMEVGYQLSGEVDDNQIIDIGHQLGADYVITGQITFSGEAYRLRVFAIDIEKGRRVASSSLNINRNDRQINHLMTTQTKSNVQENQTNVNIRNSEDVLSGAIQNISKNIPKNSRILITGITGTNDLRQDLIQEKLFEHIMISYLNDGIVLIDEKERLASVAAIEDQLKNDNVDDAYWIPLGRMVGANIIITGGVFGNRDTRRIIFRAIDVETREIVASSCEMFSQNNNDFINDVEALYQRTYNGLYGKIREESVIVIINTIGTSRNADFIFDVIENNFVNNSEYRIITRTKHIIDLIEKELVFQWSGHVSDETMVRIKKVMAAKYVLNIEFANNKIQIKIIDVEQGNTIIQESI
jgi:TolB-like protein